MQEMQVWILVWEDPVEKEMATHSSVLAWRLPWTEEPGELQLRELHRVRHDWATKHNTHPKDPSFLHVIKVSKILMRYFTLFLVWSLRNATCNRHLQRVWFPAGHIFQQPHVLMASVLGSTALKHSYTPWGPGASSTGISWQLVRNAESLVPDLLNQNLYSNKMPRWLMLIVNPRTLGV